MNRKSPKLYYYIRLIAAIYLIYIAYNLLKNWNQIESGERMLILASIIIFIFAGIAIAVISAKGLYKISQDEKRARAEEYAETASDGSMDTETDTGTVPEKIEEDVQNGEDEEQDE